MRRLAAVSAVVVCAMFGFTSVAAGAPPTNQHPVVLSARAMPPGLANTGGAVTVTGKVRDATTCKLAVLRDDHVKVSLPKSANCGNGTYSEHVLFGPNHKGSAVVLRLALIAGNARGVFYVVVAGSPAHPAILEAQANPWELPAKGGWNHRHRQGPQCPYLPPRSARMEAPHAAVAELLVGHLHRETMALGQ